MSNIQKKPSGRIGKLNKNAFTGDLLRAQTAALSKFDIPPIFRQLVLFVLDASDSMNWEGLSGKSKGEEIALQIPPILERLQNSKNSNCFDVSMIAFSEEHKEFLKVTSVKDVDLDKMDFNPCSHIGNYRTYVLSAMEEVERIVDGYFERHAGVNTQAVVLFLSDGDVFDFEEGAQVCDRLKSNAKVTFASCLLEDKNWKDALDSEELLRLQSNVKQFASNEVLFQSTVDPEEIRKHMIKSISTISKT